MPLASPVHSMHYCKMQKMLLSCTLCMYSCKWNVSCLQKSFFYAIFALLQIKYLFLLCKTCFSRKWNASCFSCALYALLQNAFAMHSMHVLLQIKCLLLAKILLLRTLCTIANKIPSPTLQKMLLSQVKCLLLAKMLTKVSSLTEIGV
jgi:hypothetical protein